MKNSTKLLIAGIVVGVIVVAAVGIKQHVTVDQEGDAITIIGGADGPTSVFLAGKLTEGENQVAEYTSITMEDAKEIFQEKGDYLIVDVRRADEFAEGHIPGAINIANEDIVSAEPAELPDKDQVIYQNYWVPGIYLTPQIAREIQHLIGDSISLIEIRKICTE